MGRPKIQGNCSEDGCEEAIFSKGLCKSHYYKQYNARRAEKQKEYFRKRYEEQGEKLRAQMRANYASNSDRYKDRAQRWREENPERKKEIDRQYREENAERLKEHDKKPHRRSHHANYMRQRYAELKREALFAYGDGSCADCGLRPDDVRDLDIHHVNNDGAAHRRELTGSSRGNSFQFYQALKERDWPNDPPLVTLCGRCHKKYSVGKQTERLRTEALRIYGDGSCANPMCGYRPTNILELELDHVNGDGLAHRTALGDPSGGRTFLLALKTLGWPNDPPLQTLCVLCHRQKTRWEVALKVKGRWKKAFDDERAIQQLKEILGQ